MDLSVNLDSKEVLFHLNYMGYRNVTKEQLKNFMIDLKKLIKYENNPVKSTEVKIQAGPANINIRRLFESQPVVKSAKNENKQLPAVDDIKLQLRESQNHNKHDEKHIKQAVRHKHRPIVTVHDQIEIKRVTKEPEIRPESAESCHRILSADSHRMSRRLKNDNKIEAEKKQQNDKENIPDDQQKPKGWIRPRSASQTAKKVKPKKKTDPVALYQRYQKDWQKFRTNICESSHSDLRWSIREKMMSNR